MIKIKRIIYFTIMPYNIKIKIRVKIRGKYENKTNITDK